MTCLFCGRTKQLIAQKAGTNSSHLPSSPYITNNKSPPRGELHIMAILPTWASSLSHQVNSPRIIFPLVYYLLLLILLVDFSFLFFFFLQFLMPNTPVRIRSRSVPPLAVKACSAKAVMCEKGNSISIKTTIKKSVLYCL
jgi:hypothetical protein